MEYVEDITCYPVCASASGAIAELIEVRLGQCSILHCSLLAPGNMNWYILSLFFFQNSYVPPDWLILLQVVLKRISTGDENESALLFKLLGTIVEGGQEKVVSYSWNCIQHCEYCNGAPAPCPRSLASGSSASFFCVVNILVLCAWSTITMPAFNLMISYYFHVNNIVSIHWQFMD